MTRHQPKQIVHATLDYQLARIEYRPDTYCLVAVVGQGDDIGALLKLAMLVVAPDKTALFVKLAEMNESQLLKLAAHFVEQAKLDKIDFVEQLVFAQDDVLIDDAMHGRRQGTHKPGPLSPLVHLTNDVTYH